MIRNVPRWETNFSKLALLIESKYKRDSILKSYELDAYKIGINHQKKLLSEEQLEKFRRFILKSHTSFIFHDDSFKYAEEIDDLEWTKIKAKVLSDYDAVCSFNSFLYDAWEKDKDKLLNLKVEEYSEMSRKSLVKKFFKKETYFSYSKNLSKHGLMVFTHSIGDKFEVGISIDAPTLNSMRGVSSDVPASFNIHLELYENIDDDIYLRYFMLPFSMFYPIAEGIAFQTYSMIKTDLDLLALLKFYLFLYEGIKKELLVAIKQDIIKK